jgi:hypothetical protein
MSKAGRQLNALLGSWKARMLEGREGFNFLASKLSSLPASSIFSIIQKKLL